MSVTMATYVLDESAPLLSLGCSWGAGPGALTHGSSPQSAPLVTPAPVPAAGVWAGHVWQGGGA